MVETSRLSYLKRQDLLPGETPNEEPPAELSLRDNPTPTQTLRQLQIRNGLTPKSTNIYTSPESIYSQKGLKEIDERINLPKNKNGKKTVKKGNFFSNHLRKIF